MTSSTAVRPTTSGGDRALVTGSPGWLGTPLVEKLVEAGWNVTCLLHPASDPSALPSACRIVRGDIRDRGAVLEAARFASHVFHLAAVIHPVWTREFRSINIEGTRNVLDAAAACGAARLVLVSSNAAQGCLHGGGLMDEEGKLRPISAYGRSKAAAEGLIAQCTERVPSVILRTPMFYGPGQPSRMTRLMRMIIRGSVPVFGSGENLRSVTFIDNMVEGLLLAARSQKAAGQVYWIADDEQPHTTMEILQAIARALERPLRCIHLPAAIARGCGVADRLLEALGFHSESVHVVGESTHWIACSIEKARTELGYAPRVGIEEGMRRAVEWCRSRGVL